MPNYLFGVAAFFFAAAFSGAAFCGAPVSAFFAPLGFGLLAGVDDCLGPGEDSAPFAFGGDPGEDSPPFAFAVGEDSAPFALAGGPFGFSDDVCGGGGEAAFCPNTDPFFSVGLT